MPTFYAMAAQVDKLAPYMLDLNYAPLVGACIVRKETWDALPLELRGKMKSEAAAAGSQMKNTSRRESVESVVVMQKRGLKVLRLAPAEIEAWKHVFEQVYPLERGRMIPADVFDETLRLVAEFRSRKTGGQDVAP